MTGSIEPDKAKAVIARFERLFPCRIELGNLLPFILTARRLFILLLALEIPNGINAPQVRDVAEQIEMHRFHGSIYQMRYAKRAYGEMNVLKDHKVLVRESRLYGHGLRRRAYFQLTTWARGAFVAVLEDVEQNQNEA